MRRPLVSRHLWFLIAVFLLLLPPAHALAGNPNPGVLPPGSNPYGKSYGEWSAAWWQWLWSAPVSQNPGLDETGANITYGQSGSVWFLAPNYGGVTVRSATIPAGKALFIDLGAFFGAPQLGDPATEPELRAVLAQFADQIHVACEIDGVALTGLEEYRVTSPSLFSYVLPEDNMFNLFGIPSPPGTYYPAASDGYFIMLAPLSAGEHRIHIVGDFQDPFIDSDVTINLVVAGRKTMLARAGEKVEEPAAPRTSWGAIKALYRNDR